MPEHFRFPGPEELPKPPIRREAEEGLGEWEHDGEQPTPPVGSLAHFKKELAANAGRPNPLVESRRRLGTAEIVLAYERIRKFTDFIVAFKEGDSPADLLKQALVVQAEIGQIVDALITAGSSLATYALFETLRLPISSNLKEGLSDTARILAQTTARALANKGVLLDNLLLESLAENTIKPGPLPLVGLIRSAMRVPGMGQDEVNKLRHLFERHRGELMTVWRENPMAYSDLVEPLMTVATDEQRAQIRLFLEEHYVRGKDTGGLAWKRGAAVLGLLFASDYFSARTMAEEILSEEFRRYGFSDVHYGPSSKIMLPKLFAAWRSAGLYTQTPDQLVNTMCIVRELERERPGSTKTLFEEFGICDFGRYPLSLLEEQYDYRENSSLMYGVILSPRADHNGAFYNDRTQLSELRESLGSYRTMRIIEWDSKIDVFRRLRQLNARYGRGRKISFSVVGGHGTWDSIQGGNRGKKSDSLSMADLARAGAGSVRQFFVHRPTHILVSCSTGAKNGIGKRLSSEFEATVFAPEESTTVAYMKAVGGDSGEPQFEVDYKSSKNQPITRRFEKGVPASLDGSSA